MCDETLPLHPLKNFTAAPTSTLTYAFVSVQLAHTLLIDYSVPKQQLERTNRRHERVAA